MPSRIRERARVVVVTGATAGVGRAIVKRFARAGDHVGLIARDVAALDALRKELEAHGAVVAVAAADVADAEAVLEAGRSLERRLGPVDIWVNDAMETVFSRFADITPQEFRRVTEVCYLGFVHGTMTRSEIDAAARPRLHRSDRFGAGLSRYSAAIGLLRRQARYSRFHATRFERS